MVSSNSSIFQLFDPFGQAEDSIAKGNVEMGDLSVIFFIAFGRSVECVFVVLNTVMEPADLFFEVTNLTCFLGIASGNGCEEPFSDGLEDVCIEIGVGCQGGCNCTR